MKDADTFLTELVDSLLAARVGAAFEQGLAVTSVDLDLPIEHRVAPGAKLELSLPRGVLSTGYVLPHGRLRLHLEPARAADLAPAAELLDGERRPS